MKDLIKDPDELIKVKFPLGYHYVVDAWELAVQSMLPGEICLIKCIPRFVDGKDDTTELLYKYEIELKVVGSFVNFEEMSHVETIEFLTRLKDRASCYFEHEMIEHAILLNAR